MPGDGLQHRTDGVAEEAYKNGLFAADLVSEGECEDGPEERTELEYVRV